MVEPVLYKTRDNPILINEQIIVRGSKAILKEVPDRFYRVKIDGYTEINEVDYLNISDGCFYVDYLMGEVHFPSSVSNDVEFDVEYYGTGYSLYPASRMYLHLQDHDTIEETLQDAITKAEKSIKIVNEISDIDSYVNEGKTLRSDLNSKITTGATLKQDLTSNISTGTTLNTNLENNITQVIEVKDEIITVANTKKSEVDAIIDEFDEIVNVQYKTIDGGDFGDEYLEASFDGGDFGDTTSPINELNGGDFNSSVIEWHKHEDQKEIITLSEEVKTKANKEEIEEKFDNINAQLADIANYNKLSKGRYIHFSIDDVSICLDDIKANQSTYTSVFNNAFLGSLKNLHDSYGAVFSLYCYVDNLVSMPTKFQSELKANSDWLKFGIHSNNGSHSFEQSLPNDAATSYNNFVSRILAFTGTTNSIDRVPRLHTFAGNLDSIRAMRDCNCGILGAITAEYEHTIMSFGARKSYYLSNAQKTHINTHHKLIDIINGLVFFPTSIRVDWFASIAEWSVVYPTSNGDIAKLIQDNDALASQGDKLYSLEIFGHEWKGNILSEFQKVCAVAKQLGLGFDFHQNRIDFGIQSINVNEIIASNTTTHMHLYNGSGKDNVIITDKFSDLKFVQPNVFIANSGDSSASGTPGRAATRYWVLKVNGTETVGLSTVGATKLSGFTFVEYTGLPLSSATVNPSGQKATSWLNTNTVLNANTRYIMLMIKNIVTDTAFTDADINIADTFLEFK